MEFCNLYMSILVVNEYMLNLYGLLLLYLLHVFWIICLCLGDYPYINIMRFIELNLERKSNKIMCCLASCLQLCLTSLSPFFLLHLLCHVVAFLAIFFLCFFYIFLPRCKWRSKIKCGSNIVRKDKQPQSSVAIVKEITKIL